jgi:hypothetical protein
MPARVDRAATGRKRILGVACAERSYSDPAPTGSELFGRFARAHGSRHAVSVRRLGPDHPAVQRRRATSAYVPAVGARRGTDDAGRDVRRRARELPLQPRAEHTMGHRWVTNPNQFRRRRDPSKAKTAKTRLSSRRFLREPTRGLEPRTPSLRVSRDAVILALLSHIQSAQMRSGDLGIAEFGTYFGTRFAAPG